jgi:hypothetical protein
LSSFVVRVTGRWRVVKEDFCHCCPWMAPPQASDAHNQKDSKQLSLCAVWSRGRDSKCLDGGNVHRVAAETTFLSRYVSIFTTHIGRLCQELLVRFRRITHSCIHIKIGCDVWSHRHTNTHTQRHQKKMSTGRIKARNT